MSREIKIHLPEAQCDALALEAKAAGRSFFDHCRAKLLADIAAEAPAMSFEERHKKLPLPSEIMPPTRQPDRIDRLEQMMMQMADAINNLANPQHIVQDEPIGEIDVDDIAGQALQIADREGLTAIQREEPVAQEGGVRPVGQRMVSRLATGRVPGHVAGLFPS